ncbi:P-loop containing nucleoside triphosphate hydrolase protein [Piromyces finnis]|uniref:p-loop containing nucleoside triphosphate hydrolase protein n=1 Tax=Piromyces finnis TaxID=1754191 RepID=A0A1Y1UVW3_9FUNG|nr:P-loop containing nucleoside triphosphate hydrolase protein [Piromyces finnis]|eukprot:ORX41365.1 P-loop containing nucleoside triphosphate hydrolase protein [Piromyces finnis]
MIYRYNVQKNKNSILAIKDRSTDDVELNEEKLRNGDEDVLREYERISNSATKNNTSKLNLPIEIVRVGKEYPSSSSISYEKFIKGIKNKNPKYGEYHLSDYGDGRLVVTSLRNVTLGINPKECFGLIGPNGAGKSSLLNLITYTTTQTIGNLYYDGIENKNIKEDHFMMGYCPQNDSLWNELTLFEHLVMFIYLRGFTKKESKYYANQYIKYCKLEDHRNKYPYELSGGTKRKLCILLALITFSNKIMLDEPSSGMDPSTRRYIWNVLQNYIKNENSSVIITTHAMEEAEVLCDRIGILVNGELQCIGSANHLKLKFNDIYILEIQCNDTDLLNSMIKKDLEILNKDNVICEVKSKNRIKYTFQITSDFSKIFEIMEDYKIKNVVHDYSFSQTTLEDIFLKFAKLQQNKEI